MNNIGGQESIIKIPEEKRKKLLRYSVHGFDNITLFIKDYSDEIEITDSYIKYIKKDSEEKNILADYKVDITSEEFNSLSNIILSNEEYHEKYNGIIHVDFFYHHTCFYVDVEYDKSTSSLIKSSYYDFNLGSEILKIFEKKGLKLPIPPYLDKDLYIKLNRTFH